MAVESKVIFSIGSKAIGGFTELKSAIDLLGKIGSKIMEVTKGLDQFSQMWERTNQKAVQMADSAAAGLIDTTEVMRGYQKLMQSGVKITEEQFKTITVRAADMAQATGQDATQAFQRLTNSISKGTTRALKEYGVGITESTEITENQQNAIKGLTEGFEDMTVKLETGTERMYALSNNLGTMAGLLYNAVGAAGAFGTELDTLNGALGEFNNWLADSPETMANFIFSLNGMQIAAMEAGREIINTLAGPFLWIEEKLNALGGIEGKGTLQQAIDDMMATTGGEQDILDKLYRDRGAESRAREKAGIGAGTGPMKTPGYSSGAGGGKKSPLKISGDELGLAGPEYGQVGQSDWVSEMGDISGAASMAEITGANMDSESLSAATDESVERMREKMALEEQDLQLQQEKDDLQRQRDEEEELRRERSLTFAGTFANTWEDTNRRVTASAFAAGGVMQLLESGVKNTIATLISGQGSVAESLRKTVEQVGKSIAVEAGWKALMEFAEAVAAAASYQYASAADHAAAGAMYLGVAAVAGVASGVAARNAPSQSSGGGGGSYTQSDSTYHGGRSSMPGDGSVNISITLKDGTEGLFDAVVEENDKASMDGRRSFA